jgi:hypothetical protein
MVLVNDVSLNGTELLLPPVVWINQEGSDPDNGYKASGVVEVVIVTEDSCLACKKGFGHVMKDWWCCGGIISSLELFNS